MHTKFFRQRENITSSLAKNRVFFQKYDFVQKLVFSGANLQILTVFIGQKWLFKAKNRPKSLFLAIFRCFLHFCAKI